MLRIRYKYFLLTLIIGLVSTVHGGSDELVVCQASASIQATAHVEPSLGLAEAHMIESESTVAALDIERGSHLFWLFCPNPSGIIVSIESLGEESQSIPKTTELQVLQEYQYASLVGLSRESMVSETADGNVLITVIYTDN